ncbi:MAG TPA: OmpA family protein [Acetobacteraceae bacterium]|jgi:OOP family OmpA-OmpF porin|nr:OmpA family protein [Acetobacteraceae bacterium]
MKLRTALLAATVMAAPVIAQAQPVTGLYIGGGLGYNNLTQQKIEGDVTANTKSTHVGFGPGFVGVGSVGWGFGNGLRAEIEGDYRNNHINSSTNGQVSGTDQTYGAMFNVLYDFQLGLPVVPYIGAGVGYQWENLQNVAISAPGVTPRVGINSTEGSFAYQGIAGVALPIPPIPGLDLTAEYRFMGMTAARKYDITFGSASSATSKVKVLQGYNNSFLVGFRYNFGVAPPPPPPAPVAAPAPAPARTYLVFFDWDRYDLTDRAKEIIAEAAQNSTKVQYTRIQVNGYTDTSGTPQYNMGLSIRRAESVKAQLITDGVPANVISIMGYGETHLLVPTGPGVREPQNRRVEIIIE